jgi:hypothetical protein
MYITRSFNLCSIRICSTGNVKSILLLCTHIYSFVLGKVRPWGLTSWPESKDLGGEILTIHIWR